MTGHLSAALPVPAPATEWVSGRGKVHPTGGYDEYRVEDEEDGATEESYRLNGEPHREDGPALIVHSADGGREETYARHGLYARPDGGPVIIRYDEGPDKPTYEEWVLDRRVGRLDGPATLEWENGFLVRETYVVDGKTHRLDGPAVIEYEGGGREWTADWATTATPWSEDDDDVIPEWHVHGEIYTEEEFGRLREALGGGAPLEWARSYAKGSKS